MKYMIGRNIRGLGLLLLIWAAGSVRAIGGLCAVSDESQLSSEDGCILAFVYNQEGDQRLVVLDEKNRHRYETPLDEPKMAPFWEGKKIYVIDVSGNMQGFTIGADKLVAEPAETISTGVVRASAYDRGQHRLYLIRTLWDKQRQISYELSAIDFPTRKTIWTKKINDPGLIQPMGRFVYVVGLERARGYNCETGERITEVGPPKPGGANKTE